MRLSLRRARRRLALTTVGVACGLAGIGFLMAAGFMELVDLLGTIRAGLVVGAVLLLVGAGFMLSARRRTAAAPADQAPHDPSSLATTMIGVGRELGAAASRNPGSFVAAAFLIGLVLGRTRR